MAKVKKTEFKAKKPLGKKLKGRVTKSGVSLISPVTKTGTGGGLGAALPTIGIARN